jgi:hypothetical protein
MTERERLLNHYVDLGLRDGWKKYVWDMVNQINKRFPGFKDDFLVRIKEKKDEMSDVQCSNGSEADKKAD